MDAGERGTIIGSGEEPCWLSVARVGGWVPGVALAVGVVSHPPIRHLPLGAGAMTVTPGAGLLSQVIERG